MSGIFILRNNYILMIISIIITFLSILATRKFAYLQLKMAIKMTTNSVFIWRGIFNGEYTGGTAVTIASSKRDAIDKLVKRIVEDEVAFGKWKLDQKEKRDAWYRQNNISAEQRENANFVQLSQLTGKTCEQIQKEMELPCPKRTGHLGTWGDYLGIGIGMNEFECRVLEELEKKEPEILKVEDLVLYNGGGD
jgi:hypothetical protein